MSIWAIYAILAGVAYGLSSVPMRYVLSRSHMSAPSEIIFLFSSIGALIGSIIYLVSSEGFGQGLLV